MTKTRKQETGFSRMFRPNAVLAAVITVAAVILFWRVSPDFRSSRRPVGRPQLVAATPLPAPEGQICTWMPVSASPVVTLLEHLQGAAGQGAASEASYQPPAESIDADRAPLRVIRDTYPTYSAVAVDLNSNEVYLQDENLFGYKVFGRLDNTPSTAAFSEPRRIVEGLNTKMEFNCALYVDPRTGDIYSVNNDTVNTLVIFPRSAEGNVAPKRELETPHGTFGIAVNEQAQELYLTVQHDNAVVAYRKMAQGEEDPLRLLQGDDTQLEDPHGIAVDTKNGWMFVTNHGSGHQVRPDPEEELRPNWPLDRSRAVRGTGISDPPSITVHSLTAEGNTAPLRIIEGPKTMLNWPAAMSVDEEQGELYVANDADDSVLVFRVTDNGNVAPARVIKGPRTQIKNPTGIFVDKVNGELWVSNMGNHRATAFDLTASGNAAPKRVIRSAPPDKMALAIGNPGAVAYDPKREEILVPN
jgi:DNA-binding beta-propeller fold protein YncE